VEHFDMAGTVGPAWGENGWILENNRSMNRAMEAMNGRIVRALPDVRARFEPDGRVARPQGVEPA
jgi:hypothetical protein